MKRIWKSPMGIELKWKFFVATVESILLYGCEAWTFTNAMEKAIDGTYTIMLRKALNVHWSEKNAKRDPLGSLSKLSDKIGAIRLRWAGHCQRHSELVAHRLILWEPTHGQRSRGRPRTTYVDQLKRDTGTTTIGELAATMGNREIWRKTVDSRLRSSK